MKKNTTPAFSLTVLMKALNQLFFANENREFEKLKNFIAS